MPYFTAAGGLYLLDHQRENKLAKEMIKKAFKIENHDTVASTQLSRSSFTWATINPLSILSSAPRCLAHCSFSAST